MSAVISILLLGLTGMIGFGLWGGNRLYDGRLFSGATLVGLALMFGLGGLCIVHPATRGWLQ